MICIVFKDGENTLQIPEGHQTEDKKEKDGQARHFQRCEWLTVA